MDFSIKNICYFKPLLAITLVSVVNSCAFALSDDSLNNTTTQNPSDNIVVYDKGYILNKTDIVQNNTIIIPSYDKENNKLTEQKYNVELKKYDYGHTDVADDVKNLHVEFFDKDVTYSVDSSRLKNNVITGNYTNDLISGDFIDLSRLTTVNNYGAAIFNNGTTALIDGDFVKNNIVSSGIVMGGAIYNTYYTSNSGGVINNIVGDFIGNYVQGNSAYGGAVYNKCFIGNITGDFVGNYADGNTAKGGAIYNTITIEETVLPGTGVL